MFAPDAENPGNANTAFNLSLADEAVIKITRDGEESRTVRLIESAPDSGDFRVKLPIRQAALYEIRYGYGAFATSEAIRVR